MMYRLLKIILVLAAFAVNQAQAFEPESTYTRRSVLADGRWVKVEVPESGIYIISNADLRKMGFSDPKRVRIHGYGAGRINLHLSAGNYIDDLPPVASEVTRRGIVFHARGPVSEETVTQNHIHHKTNPYALSGTYFLTENDGEAPEIPVTGIPGADSPVTDFNCMVYHELDLSSPGETGHLLVGEDFRYQPRQSFPFNLTGRVPDTDVWTEVAFTAHCPTASSSISISANGTALPAGSSDILPISSSESYSHGSRAVTTKTFRTDGDRLDLSIEFKSPGTVTAANLDYICINYIRRLDTADGPFCFSSQEHSLKITGAGKSTRIWDVTDPLRTERVNVSADGAWQSLYSGRRTYAVWDENMTLPSPTIAGEVPNQNIHGVDTAPDMVIFTPAEWHSQAVRIAELHRSADGMTVEVLDLPEVYNEFASGAADASAIRRCLKMFYDRGNAAGHQLRYALLMGRQTYDNRHATAAVKALGYPTVPGFQTDAGLSDNDSYSTDDYYALLLDDAGLNIFTERHCIAVGRIPVTSVAEARMAVDKLCAYALNPPEGQWKNRALFVADDQDNGRHLSQTERAIENMAATARGADILPVKIYEDAYELRDGVYEDARTEMFRQLRQGVVWWNYVGHGNPVEWSHEHILNISDINSLYLRHTPVLMAVTCDFMRWDRRDESGAEILFKNPSGGVIACISACRPVSISGNGVFMETVARRMFDCDSDGYLLTLGQLLQEGKNALSGNDNKVRYALMGDPALRPALPGRRCVVTGINGIDITESPVIAASQIATVEGYVALPDGTTDKSFNGTVSSTLYDAEYSTVTLGNGDDSVQLPFQRHGSRLYAGTDSVKAGKFRITIPMPAEISDNYAPATLNLYARSADADASGIERRFYVYGYKDRETADSVAPRIETLYLNHSSFKEGEKVSESPSVIARISDDTGLNMSLAGIGRQMTLRLDEGKRTYTDVADYFTPEAGGTRSGTIVYPLTELTDGAHSLQLKIWDTAGNSAERTIRFTVDNEAPARLIDVYTDACPAFGSVNFYIVHDRADSAEEVTIEVYDLMGRQVWTSTRRSVSDISGSFPITWNLTDKGGRRVNRGIYIYRATAEGTGSISRKIAVAGY